MFKKVLPEVFAIADSQVQDKWIKLAFEIDTVVDASVAEHSINPQNIEAGILQAVAAAYVPRVQSNRQWYGAGQEDRRDGGADHPSRLERSLIR